MEGDLRQVYKFTQAVAGVVENAFVLVCSFKYLFLRGNLMSTNFCVNHHEMFDTVTKLK